MEQLHRRILINLREVIIQDLDVTNGVINQLFEDYILKDEDVVDISSRSTTTEKARALLDILPNRGPGAFVTFQQALARHYPWLSAAMNNSLISSNTDDVDSIVVRTPTLPPVSPLTVDRKHMIKQLKTALGRVNPGYYVAIHGMKGFGRSRLAISTLKDETMHRNLFNNEIYWIRFGFTRETSRHPNALEDEILKQLNKLYHQIKNDLSIVTNDNSGFGKHELGEILKKYFNHDRHRNALLVLDDVWDRAIIETFDFSCKTLVITTDIDLLGERHKEVVEMQNGFTECESLNLFAQVLKVSITDLPQEAKDIHHACNGIPILIDLVAAQFSDFPEAMTEDGERKRWKYYLECLRKKDRTNKAFENFLDMQESIFDMCIDRLPEPTKTHYKNLAIFSEDVNISSKTLEILWGETIVEADARMKGLCNKSLAARQWNDDLKTYVYGVHDLLLDHLRKNLSAEQLSTMHRDFIEKYRNYCNGDFSKLPKDNYSFSYIGHHLEQANMLEEFPDLYLDFKFIYAKICNSGINDLLIDLKKYRRYITRDSSAIEAKVLDLEKFLKAQVKILVEHRRRDCLDLVQIGINHDIQGYFHERAQCLAESQPIHLYLRHEQQHRREEYPNGDEVPIELTTVNFTDNENQILLGSNYGDVILWDTKKRRQFQFCGHTKKSKIVKVIVSQAGDFFLALNDQGVIKRFLLNSDNDDDSHSDDDNHVHTPREKQISYSYIHKIVEDISCTTYSLDDKYITDLTDIALSPDDRRLAASTKKGHFRVWDIGGAILCTGHVKNSSIDRLAFTHKIPFLFFVDAEAEVITIYSPYRNDYYDYLTSYHPMRNTSEGIKRLQGRKAIYFSEVKIDTDRVDSRIQMLFITNLEIIIIQWNCTDDNQLSNPTAKFNLRIDPELNPGTEFTAATLTHQDEHIVIADSEGFIKVYHIYSTFTPTAVYSGKAISIDSYNLANDTHSIIAGMNRLIYKWPFQCEPDLPQSVRIPKFDALMRPINQPDIVVQVMGKKILVYEGHELIASTETSGGGDIIDLGICQDGERLMYVQKKGYLSEFSYEIRIFNYRTNDDKEIHSFKKYKSPIKFLQVNGSHVPIWKLEHNEEWSLKIAMQSNIWEEAKATGNVINLHTIGDEYVVTVADTGKIIIWKVFETAWTNIFNIQGNHHANICFSTLNLQENMLTLLKTTGEMIIYNIDRENMCMRERVSKSYGKSLTCCSYSPDGKFLAVGMDNGLISIYDIDLNRLYGELDLHCNSVLQLHWAPETIGAPILLSVTCDDIAWWNIALLNDEKKINRRSRTGIPKSSTTPTFGLSPRGSMRLSASQSASAILALAEKLENNGIGVTGDSDDERTRQFWCSKVAKFSNKPGLLGLVQLPHSCQPKVCVSSDFKKFLLVDVHGSTNTYNLFGL